MANFESSSPVMGQVSRNFDHLFKIIVIGDESVGKTGLTLRFCEDNYSTSYVATIGIDFKLRTIVVDGLRIKLQIWDTAGQERFQTLTKVYYRGTMGVIFVYDITRRKTFESVESWVKVFEDSTVGRICPKVLIGNKFDKNFEREVSFNTAQTFAIKYHMKFWEASAKTGYNVENAFLALTRDIIAQKFKAPEQVGKSSGDQQFALDRKALRSARRKKKWFSRCAIL